MIELAKPIIRQVTYLLNFKSIAPKIRFEQAQAEDVYSSFIGTQSQQTNLPDDADPSLARIIFQSAKKRIAISQTGCQIDLSFHDGEFTLEKQLGIVKNNIIDFHSKSLQFRTAESYGVTAMILDINFASKSPSSALQDYLHDRFIKTPRIGDVASVQVNVGYTLGNHFFNFSASVYELRKFEVASGGNQTAIINIEEMSVSEYGLVFKIDINNRPQLIANSSEIAENPENLFSTLDTFLGEQFEKLSGLKVG
jgi:hypothetical protein